MKIKQCLIGFPLSVIGFICLLVGIVFWNNYLSNYQHKLALKQLTISTAMLQSVKSTSEQGLSRIITDKLNQLKQFEKNADNLNNFSLIASVFILIGSMLLGVIFLYNLNSITGKLSELSSEIENINQNGLETCDLRYSFDGDAGNEVDCLATTIAQILRNLKQSNREKNGLLSLLQQSNKQLKEQLAMQCS